ncbi:unnamed protein product, partial [Effrenium voratum]
HPPRPHPHAPRAMHFGVLGPRGPEPRLLATAASAKNGGLKALKETAARALNFAHPSGNVWKPRHLFTATSSGNLRELETSELGAAKVLWVEPPWAADSVLAGGLTDRSRWSLSARMWQRLTRCSCCLPFLCATRRGIATGGGRGAPRRDAKRPKAKRLTHFVSLRMGEEVRQAAVQLQKEIPP